MILAAAFLIVRPHTRLRWIALPAETVRASRLPRKSQHEQR